MLEKAKLSTVKKGANGMLDVQYYLYLLQFIGENTRKKTEEAKKCATEARRAAYKKKDWDSYKKVVDATIKLENDAAQMILKQVIEAVGINDMEFQMTHEQLS